MERETKMYPALKDIIYGCPVCDKELTYTVRDGASKYTNQLAKQDSTLAHIIAGDCKSRAEILQKITLMETE